jgi:hypothetical protein
MKYGKLTKKLIIYLDQNFISETAKISMNSNVRRCFVELYGVLHQGFLEEKLVVPKSVFHDEETGLSGHLQEIIRSTQSKLGHVRFKHFVVVRDAQICRAARMFGRAQSQNIIFVNDAFCAHPDSQVSKIDVILVQNTDWGKKEESRKNIADELNELRKRIAQSRKTYKEQFAIEMDFERQCMQRPESIFKYRTLMHLSEAEYQAFVASEDFSKVPIMQLDVALLAYALTGSHTRKVQNGDVTDWSAMSAYLPYCDVYATDRFACGLAKSVNADTMYGCRLFSGKTGDIEALTDYIRGKIA